MAAVTNRKREVVKALVAIHLKNFQTSGAELVMGEAKIHSAQNDAVRERN